MKKIICITLGIVIACILYTCSTEKEQVYKTFRVLYYKEVPFGLNYGNSKVIKYGEKKYFPRVVAYYVKGKLQKIDVYRSDGVLSYTRKDLMADRFFTKYIDVPLGRKIIIREDSIFDSGIIASYEKRGDSLFIKQADEIIVYIYRNPNHRYLRDAVGLRQP